jgi:hypothetical protein
MNIDFLPLEAQERNAISLRLRSGSGKTEVLMSLRYYRDLLREVWASKDPDGSRLSQLYGFKKPSRPPDYLAELSSKYSPELMEWLQDRILPKGEPIVNGLSGEITWKFKNEFQQTLYELMHSRWRLRVCPECGKYLIAQKTRQMFCSEGCSHLARVNRAIEYWNREGKALREKHMKEKDSDL